MAILSIYRAKGGSHRFRRVIAPILFFLSFFSYSASVELELYNQSDLREYLPETCNVDNGVALFRCLPETFTRTIFDNGDIYEIVYTESERLNFCPDIQCNWFKQDGVWTTLASKRYEYVITNLTTLETNYHSTTVTGYLKNFGCQIRYNNIRCSDTCQDEQQCLAVAENICGDGYSVTDWRFVHVNDFYADCKPDDAAQDPDTQPPSSFDLLRGPRGYRGDDGVDGQDGEDGRDCNVYDSEITNGVYIRCGSGASATAHTLYDGAKGDKGDKGDTGAKGDDGLNGVNGLDGDSCTTSQTSDTQLIITCGETQSVLNSIEPQDTGGGSGVDDGNLDPDILAQLQQANAKTDGILSNLGGIQGQLGSVQGQLGGINGAVGGLSSQMSGMLSNQGRLIGEASATNGRLDALLGINGGMQGQLGGISGGISQANSQLTGISNSLSNIEGLLDNSDREDASEFFGNENGHPAIRDQLSGGEHMESTTTDVSDLIGSSKYLNGSGISFGSSSACPAPQRISVMGHNIEFSWQPLCDMSSIIHSIVILASLFLVYKLFIRSL